MRLKIIMFTLIFAYWTVGTDLSGYAKDYPAGTTFNDMVEFDYRTGTIQVPLPPGDWNLIATTEYSSGGDAFSVPMARLYLLRHTAENLTGAISISLPKDIIGSHWRASSVCAAKRKRRAWYAKDDSFDRNEYCNIVYPIRGFSRNSKRLKPMFRYIDQKNLTIPNSWILARYYRTKGSDLLYINYALPQENYGFPREHKYSNNDSPWSINNIDAFPKKKDFMQNAVRWAKSWQRLVDRGFRNRLDRKSVRRHPKFDGVLANSLPKTQAKIIPAQSISPKPKPVEKSAAAIAELTPVPSSNLSNGPLKPEQIKRLIVGLTAYGEGAQDNNILEFKNRGKLAGRTVVGQTDYYDDGSWLVDKTGKLCLKWNNEEFDKSACFTAVGQGNRIKLVNTGGQTTYSVNF